MLDGEEYSCIFAYPNIRLLVMLLVNTVKLFKCLSDETRLNLTLLVRVAGEACVCDLMAALDESQSKISRHLGQLRNCEILIDTRRGQWVYYALHPDLPTWALKVLEIAAESHHSALEHSMARLRDASSCQASC